MKPKVKVLKLDGWMEYNDFMFRETIEDGEYKPIQPIFNRDGIYMLQGFSWFEVRGKAYEYPSETFKYTLRMEEVKKYNQRQIDALREVCKQRLATKEQKQILYDYVCMIETRRIRTYAILTRKRIIGR